HADSMGPDHRDGRADPVCRCQPDVRFLDRRRLPGPRLGALTQRTHALASRIRGMECAPATWDYAAAMGKAVVGRAREVPRAIAAALLAIAMLAGCGGSAGTSSTGGASGSAGAASGGRGGASGNT